MLLSVGVSTTDKEARWEIEVDAVLYATSGTVFCDYTVETVCVIILKKRL